MALFLFLSGSLTSRSRVEGDPKGFRLKRLGRFFVPYLVWSAFYVVLNGRLAPWGVAGALLLGNSSAQMYYLLVYAQLVLLTPLLLRLLPGYRFALYAVTPLTLALRVAVTAFGLPGSSLFAPFCGSWLAFYLAGLE